MVKTRSQTGIVTIKKEEDCKPILTLGHASNTRNKITKRRLSKNKNSSPVSQVKVEEENTDTKSLLQSSSKYSTGVQRQYISQEHIENLIKYIVDDKMTVLNASVKANLTFESSRYYYSKYLKDPNHAILVLCLYHRHTKDQKNEFIGYIINDKMSITGASKQAKMNLKAGRRYYHEYFDDKNPDIPTPSHIITTIPHTQENRKEVISYIINDKMSIAAASRKADMCPSSAQNHYRQYLKDNNTELPVLKRYTQDQIDEFIRYIVDDKMSIRAASKKANMTYSPGKRYYCQYAKDHNLGILPKKYTHDQKNEFILYVVNEKMTVKAASEKANVNYNSGKIYYQQYRSNQKRGSYNRRTSQPLDSKWLP